MKTAQVINEKGEAAQEFVLFLTGKEARIIADTFLDNTQKARKADVKKLRKDFENAPIYI